MSWGPPHNPYEHVPERYKQMYPPDEIQLRPNAVDTPSDTERPLRLLRTRHSFRRKSRTLDGCPRRTRYR